MTCPVCRANVREAPIINHALRDILSSLIESVPESGGAAKEKLLQLKAEKEEEYQRDVGKGKRLFGGVFQSNQYARIVIDHGVPRCSRCQWEAWGGRCLYCNARFLNPREDDSEDYESPSDNSDADSDRPQQPANTHSHLSPEESARALGAARLAYARNTSDFQRDANIIIARARGIAALAGEDVSDGAEDFDYNPSDSDDEIYINENAADHYMPRQGNFSNTSLSYVANDSEDEPTVPARPRHVSRVPSVHENSSDDSVLMSDDDVHSVPLRSQHWRIASSGSSDY
ncbi:unnamed protein product [Kuraishia capsulata CBS 1993]|uniref:RING-type domain-containing protein n=1 Tax=Kuraishia capsulata CBS 1993 TaxID=1382522 RepID=W6MK85_9ASCO|nr:uncharacterized protein KUCA_T00002380001 [Kuraishia capsulata CBS 1993]CDK26408.1 unnamed protein product [Kuraishia capsulata CBS 1993]